MKLGIVTPVLTLLGRAHASWETTADFGDVVTIACAAERFGYDHLTCSEHVALPESVVARRGGRYFDPVATLGALSAHTETIRLATFVLVLGYHHPLELAKRYGTLDLISGGRVTLGVGVGSLEEEFELLGAEFERRGDRGDDALRALRCSFGRRVPEYHGEFFDYSGFVVDPCGIQTDIPIWIGGRTHRSLRRAVELADGWAPFQLNVDEVARMLLVESQTDAWGLRSTPIEVLLQPDPIDPLGNPDATATTIRELRDASATGMNTRFVHHSLAHYLEQLEALPQLLANIG